VIWILSICCLISITNGCLKSEPEIIPFEANQYIIQKLPNGNLEVKPDFIFTHFKVLQTAVAYKAKYEILLKEYKKITGGME